MSLIASPVNPGEILAEKYQVERALGQGGMGIVVAARHLELDQTVAIKFLIRDAPPNALERFMREAKAAALVKSEHVCRVYDVGRLASGEPYIVMEYLEGSDLADKLEAEGPQPFADVIGWVIQTCDALSSAHSQGIVHRDLKPANLFLQQGSDGPTTLKVVDFGISKLATSGALTSTAVLMGSPFYMSPEQLESSRDVDLRSDIWSMGIVLYELLAGVPPFTAETLVQIVVQAREQEPVPLHMLRPEIPKAIERVIAKCLAKNAANRYQNVNELVVDLAPFAPPEMAAIVKKLSKRAGRSSDPALVLSKTVNTDPVVLARASQATRRDTPNARGSDGNEVADAPPSKAISVQTDPSMPHITDVAAPDAEATRRKSARARVAVAGSVLGVVVLLAVGFVITRTAAPGARILQETTLSSSTVIDSSPLTSASTPTPATTTSAPVPALVTSTVLAVPSASASSAIPSTTRPGGRPTSRPGTASPPPSGRASAAPLTTVSTPAPAGSAPKRRDVDRDYEP
jgi:serine/threonine protein kinase